MLEALLRAIMDVQHGGYKHTDPRESQSPGFKSQLQAIEQVLLT